MARSRWTTAGVQHGEPTHPDPHLRRPQGRAAARAGAVEGDFVGRRLLRDAEQGVRLPDGSEVEDDDSMFFGQAVELPGDGKYTFVFQALGLGGAGDTTITIWNAADAPAVGAVRLDWGIVHQFRALHRVCLVHLRHRYGSARSGGDRPGCDECSTAVLRRERSCAPRPERRVARRGRQAVARRCGPAHEAAIGPRESAVRRLRVGLERRQHQAVGSERRRCHRGSGRRPAPQLRRRRSWCLRRRFRMGEGSRRRVLLTDGCYLAGGAALVASAFLHWIARGAGSGLRGHVLVDACSPHSEDTSPRCRPDDSPLSGISYPRSAR